MTDFRGIGTIFKFGLTYFPLKMSVLFKLVKKDIVAGAWVPQHFANDVDLF